MQAPSPTQATVPVSGGVGIPLRQIAADYFSTVPRPMVRYGGCAPVSSLTHQVCLRCIFFFVVVVVAVVVFVFVVTIALVSLVIASSST